MKYREDHVRRLCQLILAGWRKKRLVGLKEGAGDVEIIAKMMDEFSKEFAREEELDRDSEALLAKHSRGIDLANTNTRTLFLKIRERLADERGIVL